jgi:hypothetical protein
MQGDYEIQFNYNPVKIYEVNIDVTGKERGYEIQHLTLIKCLERYSESFEFAGKALTIWVVSNDRRINRRVALHFAASVALGKVTRHTVSTAHIIGYVSKKKRGK